MGCALVRTSVTHRQICNHLKCSSLFIARCRANQSSIICINVGKYLPRGVAINTSAFWHVYHLPCTVPHCLCSASLSGVYHPAGQSALTMVPLTCCASCLLPFRSSCTTNLFLGIRPFRTCTSGTCVAGFRLFLFRCGLSWLPVLTFLDQCLFWAFVFHGGAVMIVNCFSGVYCEVSR